MAVVLDLVNLEPDGGSGRQGGSPKTRDATHNMGSYIKNAE
jgi:hypothetical protein